MTWINLYKSRKTGWNQSGLNLLNLMIEVKGENCNLTGMIACFKGHFPDLPTPHRAFSRFSVLKKLARRLCRNVHNISTFVHTSFWDIRTSRQGGWGNGTFPPRKHIFDFSSLETFILELNLQFNHTASPSPSSELKIHRRWQYEMLFFGWLASSGPVHPRHAQILWIPQWIVNKHKQQDRLKFENRKAFIVSQV